MRGTGPNDLATNAAAALGIIEQTINEVALGRGEVGAFVQNTVLPALNTLNVAFENLTAAESTIRDQDIARGVLELTAARLRNQFGIGVLSQANVTAGAALRLLGNL